MSTYMNTLIHESTNAGDIDAGRPSLVALTHAVNALIYTDLVAIQPSQSPIANLLGLRYLNRDGDMSFRSMATYAGKYGDRTVVTDELSATKSSFAKDDVFKYEKVIYQAIVAVNLPDLGGGDDLSLQLNIALMMNKIRIVSDAGELGEMEYIDPSESNLSIDKWKIELKTRKLKTEVTNEFLQDVQANGINGDGLIRSLLATELSEEINRDIIQKLQTVSMRHESTNTQAGIYYAGGAADDPAKGRTLYRIVCEMSRQVHAETSYEATYVVCTPKVAALLSSSGWIKGDPVMDNLYTGTLVDGLKVYVDPVSRFDYVVVGTKQQMDTVDMVGSLFYSPYAAQDGVGSMTVINSVENLQPKYMTMARYALSVNPYTIADAEDTKQIYPGDDWNSLAGKSKYSRFTGVIF